MTRIRSRRPIDPAAVAALLADPGRWPIEFTAQTGSTNADLAARADAAPLEHGQVLVTEEQTAGRGGPGRDWHCPPGAGLMFSVAAAPAGRARRTGGAGSGPCWVCRSCRAWTGSAASQARLKWPNDVLIDGAKCAGILGEMAGDALIIGSGINVSLDPGRAAAGGRHLAGCWPAARLDRAALLAAILDELGGWCDRWTAAAGDVDAAGIRPRYRTACATLGADVRLLLPNQRWVTGTAVDVDTAGALVVVDAAGRSTAYTAGDVVHVRRP